MFKRFDLTSSRIMITGASSGIGAELAKKLATMKARLVLAARSSAALEATAKEIRSLGAEVLAVPTDITVAEERQRLIAETVAAFGGFDILVNNAGIGATGRFVEASEARLRKIFEVNFFGAVELTRLAIPHLQQGRNPIIANIASVIGRRGYPGHSEYCASKFALVGWTESIRAELRQQGIRVLLVCPGPIATDFSAHLVENKLPTPPYRAMPTERCAQLIVQAMCKHANEVIISTGGKILLQLNRWFPRFVDYIMAKDFSRIQQLGPDLTESPRST